MTRTTGNGEVASMYPDHAKPASSATPVNGSVASYAQWRGPDLSAEERRQHALLVSQLRTFNDTLSASAPDTDALAALAADLAAWTDRLSATATGEHEQFFGRRPDLPDRGQTMTPAITAVEYDAGNLWGRAIFGRHFAGSNGAAHGGAIALLFDEVLGRVANAGGGPVSRTAYLKTDFRSVTPTEVSVDFTAWREREEGRKIWLRAELRNGDRVCAESEALFITLREGQP